MPGGWFHEFQVGEGENSMLEAETQECRLGESSNEGFIFRP
jgi:hypothetical protein